MCVWTSACMGAPEGRVCISSVFTALWPLLRAKEAAGSRWAGGMRPKPPTQAAWAPVVESGVPSAKPWTLPLCNFLPHLLECQLQRISSSIQPSSAKGPLYRRAFHQSFGRQTDRQTDITEVHTRNSKGIFCTSPNSTYCPRLGHTSSCSLQLTLSGPIPQPVDLITSGQFSGVAAVSPVSSDALKLTGSRMSFSSLYLLTCQPRAAHPAGAGHLEIGQ